MGLKAGGYVVVAVGFTLPASLVRVLAKGDDVGELSGEGVAVLGPGGEVLALLTDVGVGTCASGGVASAVAAGEAGFEHLGVQPVNPFGDRRRHWRRRRRAVDGLAP